jgi:serine/threonine protein kinase
VVAARLHSRDQVIGINTRSFSARMMFKYAGEADSLQGQEGRTYRLLRILGQGGFGKVYHARLEGPEGFLKDVAIKVIKEHLTGEALQRFRDEARILGLINDRAVVSAEPPVQFQGRWAVIMDYAEGASVAALVAKQPLPAAVALEVVLEVARVLDRVWNQLGPDGEPLRLIHRDIKPANIQVSSSGEVRLLDFGIARADFSQREALTSDNIAGTLGYIAPERLMGDEFPAGDVYSLGVTLAEMVTGKGPMRLRQPMTDVDTEEFDLIAGLANHMRAIEPEERPSAREVERRIGKLLVTLPGARLRDWAESHVPQAAEPVSDDDEMIGTLVDLRSQGLPRLTTDHPVSDQTLETEKTASPQKPGRIWRGILGALVGTLLGVGALFLALRPPGAPTSTAETHPTGQDVPAPAPLSIAAPAPEPTPAAASPNPARIVVPERPEPVPLVQPASAPAATFPVTFTSVPMNARVVVDGTFVGMTPLLEHPMPAGPHQVRIELGDDATEQTVEVGRRAPTRFVWKVREDAWSSGY